MSTVRRGNWSIQTPATNPKSRYGVHLAVARATSAAKPRNARVIIEAALATASAKDIDFLKAMSVDDGPSYGGVIRSRNGALANMIANDRLRLIVAGLIESAGYGKVDFAIPGLREHTRDLV
jgi:hypothetical protein